MHKMNKNYDEYLEELFGNFSESSNEKSQRQKEYFKKIRRSKG